jgi:hypothetical protein
MLIVDYNYRRLALLGFRMTIKCRLTRYARACYLPELMAASGKAGVRGQRVYWSPKNLRTRADLRARTRKNGSENRT